MAGKVWAFVAGIYGPHEASVVAESKGANAAHPHSSLGRGCADNGWRYVALEPVDNLNATVADGVLIGAPPGLLWTPPLC